MKDFIIQLVSMSIQASIAIVVVLVLRLLFAKCKISKKYVMLLWVIPFVCLILPWRIASPIAIWDKAPSDYGYEDLVEQDTPFEDEIGQGNNAGDIVGTPGNDTNSGANGNEQTPGNPNNNVGNGSGELEETPGNPGDNVGGTVETPGNNAGNNTGNNAGSNAGDIVGKPGDNSGSDIGANNGTNAGTNSGTGIEGEDKTPIGSDKIAVTQIIQAATIIWGMVVLVLALYSGISYGKLKKQLSQRVRMHDNIYMVDDLEAPIVVGFRKPEIYIPSGYNTEYMEYVIAHEQTHIRRKDIVSKMAAYCVTCIHWFNPLVWLAYNLMIKDMEMACDEETVTILGYVRKHEYATALLQLSTGRRHVLSVPLAFGEGGTKMRIVNILKFEKTKQILAIVALAIGIVLAIVFLTKGIENAGGSASGTENMEGVGNTETESEETEGTEETETTDAGVGENTESETEDSTEVVIDPVEQDIEYKRPNITYRGTDDKYIEAGKIVDYEPEYYNEVVPFFDGDKNYEMEFQWYYVKPGSKTMHVNSGDYAYKTERGGWWYHPFGKGYGTTWENYILLHYEDWVENKVTFIIYNALTDKAVATYKADMKYNDFFRWAFIPELNQAVIEADEGKIFIYENGEMIDRTDLFVSMEGWEDRVQIIDGNIVLLSFNRTSHGIMTQIYNPTDQSVRIGLKETKIEDNYTNTGTVIVTYAGKYGFARVEGKDVFINLLTGEMAEAQIDLKQYQKILTIDGRSAFFFKKNGYWKIVDMETGEVVVQSKYAIQLKGVDDNEKGNDDRVSIVTSLDGKAYLKVEHRKEYQTQSFDYYDLGYYVAGFQLDSSTNGSENTDSETEDTEEEEIIVYQEPDIIKDSNHAADDSKWGHWIIENNELVFCEYENAVSCVVTLTHWEQEYEVPFRWAIHEGELVTKVDLSRETGDEEWFNVVPVDGSTDLIVIEIVGKQVGPTEAYLYSIEKGGLLPFIGEDVMGVAEYITGADKYMVLPEYSQTLLVDSSSVLVYLHDEDRYHDISSLFGSNQSTKYMVREDDKLLVYCFDNNGYKLSVYAYDPENYSVTKIIDGLSYETSTDIPHSARMRYLSGGICSGLIGGEFSYIDVLKNEIVPAEFDIYEYQWTLDIDSESVLLIKENGHWDIVNKRTGKITHSSEMAIEINALGIPLEISEEGILYVRATNNQNQTVYYKLPYVVQN